MKCHNLESKAKSATYSWCLFLLKTCYIASERKCFVNSWNLRPAFKSTLYVFLLFFFLIFLNLFRDSKSFSYPGGFCLFNDTLSVAVYCVHSWSFGLGITNRKYFILKGVASGKGTHDAFNLSWNSKSNCKNSQNKWRRKWRVSFYFVEYCKETLELTLV